MTSSLVDLINGIRPLTYEVRCTKSNENSHNKELYLLQLDKLETRLKRCKEAYQNGIDSLEEYANNKKVITAEIEQMRTALNEIDAPAAMSKEEMDAEMLKNLINVHEALASETVSKDEKAHALRSICESITYNKADGTLEFFLYYSMK